jgi:hypothetical protein
VEEGGLTCAPPPGGRWRHSRRGGRPRFWFSRGCVSTRFRRGELRIVAAQFARERRCEYGAAAQGGAPAGAGAAEPLAVSVVGIRTPPPPRYLLSSWWSRPSLEWFWRAAPRHQPTTATRPKSKQHYTAQCTVWSNSKSKYTYVSPESWSGG